MPIASATPAPPGSAVSLWASAAHDLRQPLQGVKLLTGVLAEEPDANARRAIRARMDAAVQSLQTMVDRLTEIAALESSGSALRVAPCRLDDLLSEIARELQGVAAHRAGTIVALSSGLTVSSERRFLSEAVRGLALHAFWLDPVAHITLRAHPDGQETVIEVATTAPLPATSCSPRLFTELPLTVNGEPALATGLGFLLIAHVAALLGLTLQTTAAPAGGTVYALRSI